MLREIRLYGFLGEKFGKVHKLDVASPAEAVRALCYKYKAFKRVMLEYQGKGFAIFAGDGNLLENELVMEFHNTKPFKIVPVFTGAGDDGGILSIILGIIIIVVAFWTQQWQLAAVAKSAWASAAVSFGTSMILSGVFTLIAKPPKMDTKEKKRIQSDLFHGTTNMAMEGVPVPLVYGRHMVGSIVVSQGLITRDASVG